MVCRIAGPERGAVLGAFKWRRTYAGVAAAPPTVSDLILGQLGYIALRVLVGAGAFLLVMLPFAGCSGCSADERRVRVSTLRAERGDPDPAGYLA